MPACVYVSLSNIEESARSMKVLLVDDDPDEMDITTFLLRRDGFVVVGASDEAEALRRFRREQPNIVVATFELLSSGGVELLRRIRAEGRTPVLVTIGRRNSQEVLRSVDLGADDFIVKPYIWQELALRVQAIVRRVTRDVNQEPEVTLEVGDIHLDPEAHIAARGSFEVRLTPTEFRICYALLESADRVVPIDRLLMLVAGSKEGAASSLRSHICHLRKKLALDGGLRGSIASVPAVGYVFRVPQQEMDLPGAFSLPHVAAGS